MAKKHKSSHHNATNSAYDRHDHRADELAFNLMSAARDIAFDVVSRDKGVIKLHAHTNTQSNEDPITVIVTTTDYVINGEHFDTVAQTLDALASVHTN